MEPVRSLREVLGELAGAGPDVDPGHALREAGHGDLPDELLSEAVASYADTSSLEVAEHLAPFVTAYRQAGEADPAAALDLLTHAPTPGHPDAPAPIPSLLEAEVEAEAEPVEEGLTGDGPGGLEFGLGDRTEEASGLAPAAETGGPAPGDEGFPTPTGYDPLGSADAGPDLDFPALPDDDVADDLWPERPPDGPAGEDDAGLDPTA